MMNNFLQKISLTLLFVHISYRILRKIISMLLLVLENLYIKNDFGKYFKTKSLTCFFNFPKVGWNSDNLNKCVIELNSLK